MSKVIKFFLKLGYQYRFRLTFLITYTVFSSYIIAFWPLYIDKALHSNFAKFALLCMAFAKISFNYVREVFLFPVYNYASYQLKLHDLDSAHNNPLYENSAGEIIARQSRSASSKYIIRALITCFNHAVTLLTTLWLISMANLKIGLITGSLLFCYLGIIFLIQKRYKILRNHAWNKTEHVGKTSQQILDQTRAIRQGLQDSTLANKALQSEYETWHKYYFITSFYYISLSFICAYSVCVLFITGDFTQSVLLLSWNFALSLGLFTESLKILYSTFVDVEVFLQDQYRNQTQYEMRDYLLLEDVYIKIKDTMRGPVNLITKASTIIMTGNNGVGKTRLALAIAGLVPYAGTIARPSALYISLDDKKLTDEKLSKGENVIELLKQACEKEYGLLIIDEMLDLLSPDALKKAWQMLHNSNKMLLIITHKEEIMQFAHEIIAVTRDLHIQHITKMDLKN